MPMNLTQIRFNNIRSVDLPLTNIKLLHSLFHCFKFNPSDRLSNAFAHYGHIEIYADGKAAQLLNNPYLTNRIISNQRAGMTFERNVRDVFSGYDLITLTHEEGPLYFLGSTDNLGKAKEIELFEKEKIKTGIAAVIESETDINRFSATSKRLPTLGEKEGDLLSGPNQELLTQTLSLLTLPKFLNR